MRCFTALPMTSFFNALFNRKLTWMWNCKSKRVAVFFPSFHSLQHHSHESGNLLHSKEESPTFISGSTNCYNKPWTKRFIWWNRGKNRSDGAEAVSKLCGSLILLCVCSVVKNIKSCTTERHREVPRRYTEKEQKIYHLSRSQLKKLMWYLPMTKTNKMLCYLS